MTMISVYQLILVIWVLSAVTGYIYCRSRPKLASPGLLRFLEGAILIGSIIAIIEFFDLYDEIQRALDRSL